MKKEKVIIGLSGGVDSAVAALLLIRQGYDVAALFMKNWHDTVGLKSEDCPFEEDVFFAEMVAKKLEIPFHVVDLSSEYKKRVVDYMFHEYKNGRTPNPDVLCNREIKFDVYLKEALKLGADLVATGHYCKKEVLHKNHKKIFRLLAGKDKNKDQSYFLCQLSQNQLKKVIFPLENLTKPEVRKMAYENELPSAKRKDSQGICFIGKIDLPTFLQQKLEAKAGDVIEIPKTESEIKISSKTLAYELKPAKGKVIGKHQGAHFFTIGQRRGLDIGGKPEPLFVLGTDVKKNIVYVGLGHDHPFLLRKQLFIPQNDIHWLRDDLQAKPGEIRNYLVRIRYRQSLQNGLLDFSEKGLVITFNKPQRAITQGQFAAWYEGDELIGSGVIS